MIKFDALGRSLNLNAKFRATRGFEICFGEPNDERKNNQNKEKK